MEAIKGRSTALLYTVEVSATLTPYRGQDPWLDHLAVGIQDTGNDLGALWT